MGAAGTNCNLLFLVLLCWETASRKVFPDQDWSLFQITSLYSNFPESHLWHPTVPFRICLYILFPLDGFSVWYILLLSLSFSGQVWGSSADGAELSLAVWIWKYRWLVRWGTGKKKCAQTLLHLQDSQCILLEIFSRKKLRHLMGMVWNGTAPFSLRCSSFQARERCSTVQIMDARGAF